MFSVVFDYALIHVGDVKEHKTSEVGDFGQQQNPLCEVSDFASSMFFVVFDYALIHVGDVKEHKTSEVGDFG